MAMKNGKPKFVQRELPVKLTDKEKLDKGVEMAEVEMEIADLVVKRQSLNAKILEAGKTRRQLGKEIDDGTALRMVRCRQEEDFPKNVWRYFREDTGEELPSETMSVEDRQQSLESTDFDDDEPGLSAGESAGENGVQPHADPARRAPKKPKTGKGRKSHLQPVD